MEKQDPSTEDGMRERGDRSVAAIFFGLLVVIISVVAWRLIFSGSSDVDLPYYGIGVQAMVVTMLVVFGMLAVSEMFPVKDNGSDGSLTSGGDDAIETEEFQLESD